MNKMEHPVEDCSIHASPLKTNNCWKEWTHNRLVHFFSTEVQGEKSDVLDYGLVPGSSLSSCSGAEQKCLGT